MAWYPLSEYTYTHLWQTCSATGNTSLRPAGSFSSYPFLFFWEGRRGKILNAYYRVKSSYAYQQKANRHLQTITQAMHQNLNYLIKYQGLVSIGFTRALFTLSYQYYPRLKDNKSSCSISMVGDTQLRSIHVHYISCSVQARCGGSVLFLLIQ